MPSFILGLENLAEVDDNRWPFLMALDKAILAGFVIELTIRWLYTVLLFSKGRLGMWLIFIVVGGSPSSPCDSATVCVFARAQSIACIARTHFRNHRCRKNRAAP